MKCVYHLNLVWNCFIPEIKDLITLLRRFKKPPLHSWSLMNNYYGILGRELKVSSSGRSFHLLLIQIDFEKPNHLHKRWNNQGSCSTKDNAQSGLYQFLQELQGTLLAGAGTPLKENNPSISFGCFLSSLASILFHCFINTFFRLC